MQTDAYRLWSSRIVTFALSALAAASAGYWGLKGWGPATPSSVPVATLAHAPLSDPKAVARALGGGLALASVTPGTLDSPVASRYVLVGVMAGNSRKGAALISVDGQEARPVRVGNTVDSNMVLFSVSGRRAILSSVGDTSAKITLELPQLGR